MLFRCIPKQAFTIPINQTMTNTKTDQMLELKAPGDERQFFAIPAQAADLSRPYNANLLTDNGAECEIRDNIIHLLKDKPGGTTFAQSTNFWGVTAKVYENTWRKNSIGIISGQSFTLEDEQNLLKSWLRPQPGEWIADVGCSSGFYARTLAGAEPEARVIALDFSMGMLGETRSKAIEEKAGMYLLLADAESMPFYAGSMDALACGGSLNEFANPEKVLYEMKRTLKPGGRCFMMHLLRGETWYGRLLQGLTETSGLHFWSESESDKLFAKTGFKTERRYKVGNVCFSLLVHG